MCNKLLSHLSLKLPAAKLHNNLIERTDLYHSWPLTPKRVQIPPYPLITEPSCTQPAQQPHGTKRTLPRLAPAAPRVQEAPSPLIIETSCDRQRTGCDQSRLYPKRKKPAPPDPNKIHYLVEQALTLLQQDLDSVTSSLVSLGGVLGLHPEVCMFADESRVTESG